MSNTLLDRAIFTARRRGMTRAEFARDIVEVSPVTLWRITTAKRELKPTEVKRIRAFLATATTE